MKNAGDAHGIEWAGLRMDETIAPVLDADDFPVEADAGFHSCANNGVEARTITAAGQDSDFHFISANIFVASLRHSRQSLQSMSLAVRGDSYIAPRQLRFKSVTNWKAEKLLWPAAPSSMLGSSILCLKEDC